MNIIKPFSLQSVAFSLDASPYSNSLFFYYSTLCIIIPSNF
nr:MAG TPA: hypothetical protein [Caudoviricetes sp.]